MEKLPIWLIASGFFTIVALLYIVLNNTLGFANEAYLFSY